MSLGQFSPLDTYMRIRSAFTCLDKGIINNEMSVSMKKLMPLYVEFLCSSGDTEVLNTQSSLDSPVKLLCSTKIQDYMA